MKKRIISLAACLLILFINACKKDVNHQPAPGTKSSSSTAVPDGYTLTSVGLLPDSNVTLIEAGYKLSFLNGHAYKVHIASGRIVRDLGKVMPQTFSKGAAPNAVTPQGAPSNSPRAKVLYGNSGQSNTWITYAEWKNTTSYPITNFTTNWTVPMLPASQIGQNYAIWMGVIPTDTGYPQPTGQALPLLQPLLIWGNSGGQLGGGQYWTIVSYIIWKNSSGQTLAAISTPIHNVAVGTNLQAQISSSGQQPDGSYNCVIQFVGQTSLTVTENATLNLATSGTAPAPFIPALNYAYEVLEIPAGSPYITSINEYPDQGVPMTSIGITTGFGSNATNPYLSWISSSANNLQNGAANGEHTDIIASNQVNIYMQPHPVISYPSPDYLYVGTPYTLNPTSTGGTITSYSTTGLPGLSLNTSNGQITGTPSYPEAQYYYNVTATGPGGTGTFPITITTELPGISFGITNNSANGLSLTFTRTDQSQANINYIANAYSGTNYPASIPPGTYTIGWSPSGSPANCVVTLSNGQSSPNAPGGRFTGVVINNSGGVNSLSAR